MANHGERRGHSQRHPGQHRRLLHRQIRIRRNRVGKIPLTTSAVPPWKNEPFQAKSDFLNLEAPTIYQASGRFGWCPQVHFPDPRYGLEWETERRWGFPLFQIRLLLLRFESRQHPLDLPTQYRFRLPSPNGLVRIWAFQARALRIWGTAGMDTRQQQPGSWSELAPVLQLVSKSVHVFPSWITGRNLSWYPFSSLLKSMWKI